MNKEDNFIDLIDAYAEARHTHGDYTYNVKTQTARNAILAALAATPAQLDAVGAGGVGALISNAERKGAATLEPFGYFKAEPFGWTDCAETDEGAIALYDAPQPQQITEPESQTLVMDTHRRNGLAWAVAQWESEVKNRPMVNVHRRNLDGTWRQVVRYFDGDPDALLSPSHDDLLSANAAQRGHNPKEPS